MQEKALEERYSKEILTDNTKFEKCSQCKDCIFKSDGTVYSNNYQKSSCAIFPYPQMKPDEVRNNAAECDYYEKDKD